jgi:hypothetical protein
MTRDELNKETMKVGVDDKGKLQFGARGLDATGLQIEVSALKTANKPARLDDFLIDRSRYRRTKMLLFLKHSPQCI